MAKDFKPNVGKKTSKVSIQDGIAKFGAKYRPDPNVDTKSVFFGRDALLKMLSQEGSSGITVFLMYGPSPDFAGKETIQLAMVPTKEDGSLIWTAEPEAAALTTSASAETNTAASTSTSYGSGALCPPYCPS
jgi:hypothetical protein